MEIKFKGFNGKYYNSKSDALKAEMELLPKEVKLLNYEGKEWKPNNNYNHLPNIVITEAIYEGDVDILNEFVYRLAEDAVRHGGYGIEKIGKNIDLRDERGREPDYIEEGVYLYDQQTNGYFRVASKYNASNLIKMIEMLNNSDLK